MQRKVLLLMNLCPYPVTHVTVCLCVFDELMPMPACVHAQRSGCRFRLWAAEATSQGSWRAAAAGIEWQLAVRLSPLSHPRAPLS